MTDSEKLKDKIKGKGLKYTFIAQQIGVSLPSFSKKVNGFSGFKPHEVRAVSEILGLTAKEMCEIFMS